MPKQKLPPVFKEYTMGQIVLLPTNLDEMIPANHLVRVVNQFIEQMDLGPILAKYKGGGTSSYHPKMMLKVIVYAYTQRIYSSRRIAKALRESIPFLWLSGLNQPDFRTINRFRGEILKGIIEEVFLALLKLLIAAGYVKLEDYFVDGTKIEANANRYTAVWAKNTERYEKQLAEKVHQLMATIEQLNQAEDAQYGDQDLAELGERGPVDEQQLAAQVAQLNEQLRQPEQVEPSAPEPPRASGEAKEAPEQVAQAELCEPAPPTVCPEAKEALGLVSQIEAQLAKVQQAAAAHPEAKGLAKVARTLANDCLPRARKYAQQRQILAGRNSYSKTDEDATFFHMKEDHRPGSQPKPAYNLHLGTEKQFVVHFSVHQQAGDAPCLIPHLAQLKDRLGRLPAKVDSDAGYGSEENYAYLDQEQVGNYLKYNTFDREQKKRYTPNPFHVDSFPYDAEQDVFTCPAGKAMPYLRTEHRHSDNGFLLEHRVYTGQDCASCPLKEKCTRAAGNRLIRVSFNLRRYRQQARDNLLSETGQRLRKQRGVDVEPVFGHLKEDRGFRRFLLRGLQKVTVECGLLCLAHDLAKVWSCENAKNLAGA